MTTEPGPSLEALTDRLARVPPEFLLPAGPGGPDSVAVAAVISDLLRDLGGEPLTRRTAASFAAAAVGGRAEPARQRRASVMLLAAWLLADRWFRDAKVKRFAPAARELLASGLDDLAAIVEPARFVSDPDRREELARVCLRALGLRPAGETEAQASDRLATLDSAERIRVLRDTRKAQERVREIREAMKKKAAEEAAAAYARE